MTPKVLYLSMVGNSPSHEGKLAGVSRYCASRGWEAVPVLREDVSIETLPGILRRHRPVGCVVDGVGRHADLPPRLFGGIPVAYIGYPSDKAGQHPDFHFDPAAIAEMALRELSAGRPPCYAAVGQPAPWAWSRGRIRAFRAAVRASAAKSLVFPTKPRSAHETWDDFVERLARWLARLPEHCAVFAVSDETALRVVRAAHDARRHVPKSLTLVSVDNFATLCEGADPPISSIQLDFEREGFLAAKALEESVSRKGGPASVYIAPLFAVRRKSTRGRGRREQHILTAVEMIRREACDGLSARDLAARFPGSRRLFEMRFREAMGHAVLDEILYVRMERAFTLLARTDTAIGSIPALCGFRSYAALDFLFRTRFRMSMREWRKRNSHA
jgi:LacI family transcriptional regulator